MTSSSERKQRRLRKKEIARRQYDEQDFDGNIRELERKSDEITAARFRQSSFELKQEIDKYDLEISELSNDIRRLENKKRTFPRDVEIARQKLQEKLRSEGLNIDVHLLAELVTKVVRPEWQQAVECFMGRDRYALVVEDNYVAAARDAYKALGLNSPRLVLSDRIEDPSGVKAASLSSLLEVKSPEGRKYINYRFNHIHLCADLTELHEHSTGGITVDGYRATGHSMDKMKISQTDYTLGEDAIRLELDRKKSMKFDAEKLLNEKTALYNSVNEIIAILDNSDFKTDKYHFEAIGEIGRLKSELKSTTSALDDLKNDPSFIALNRALEIAGEEYKRAREMLRKRSNSIAVCENDIENTKRQINEFAADIFNAQKELQEYELKHLDIKAAARDEYDKHISGHDDGILYSQNTIRRAETDRQKIAEDLQMLQMKFCSFAGMDISKVGVAYIGFYRELKNELMNVKAEETRQKLEDTSKNLESTFITDFVAQINENIQTARDEIDKINAELETLPFGNDIYKFKADERSDKAAFLRLQSI